MSAEGKIVADSLASATRRPCFDVLAMMGEVIGALAEERAQDGWLKVEDLKRILEMAKGAGSPLARAFEAQEARCRQHFRPAVRHASSRNDVFRRLMVRPFETLLEGDPPAFPRSFLANYFELVEAAFGDKLKHYDERSRQVFQDMLVAHGNDLAWDVFFSDARARAILAHALARLMHYIDSPAGQWAWLTCFNRQNLDGAKPTSEQADMVLAALKTTRDALGPPHEKKS